MAWVLRFGRDGWTHFHSRVSGVRYSVSPASPKGLYALFIEGQQATGFNHNRAGVICLIELTDEKLGRLKQNHSATNRPGRFLPTRARVRTHRA
jgi:hypothetical protein